MKLRLRAVGAVLLASLVFGRLVQPAAGAGLSTGQNYAHPNWLVTASWLRQHLGDPHLKVIAVTPEADFFQGHIPGAAQIDWPSLGITDTSPSSIAQWRGRIERDLTRLGVGPRDTIVLYDGGTLFASRLWWVLDDLGQTDKRILMGGMSAWTMAGGKVDRGASTVLPATTPYQGKPDPADLATLDQVKASLGQSNVVIIDARSKGEYDRGHIPGAINLDYRGNAMPGQPDVWKPETVLHQLYAGAGATKGKDVIAYCSTGVRSAVTYFTLRLIGYSHVRLYTGSWAEWSQHPGLPKAKTGPG